MFLVKEYALMQSTVQQHIMSASSVLVAYSGGVDSTVLLHILVELRKTLKPDLSIQAVYVHHGISSNADDWARHCQAQCQRWQVPLVIEKVQLDLQKGNIEQQARDARYHALSKHLSPQTILCTAQHLDDQCETFMLALKRGSGPTGLSAIAEKSDFGNNRLLRPLLTISRQQIEAYAQHYQLDWVEDESNQDDHYDRNFLRLNILPLLYQRWPHFSQMVARSAQLCGEQQQLLDELLSEQFQQLLDKQNTLLLEPLLSCSMTKRNALIRMWFKAHEVNMPSRRQLELLWQTVVLAKEDSNPQFIVHNKQIRRYQGRLYLLPQYSDLENSELNWDLKTPLILPDQVGQIMVIADLENNCRSPMENEQVTIRFRAQGQFNIVGRHGSRAIKKLWQEFNIPPWMRGRIPLIYYNEQLITAVGVFVTEQGKGNELQFIVK